MSSVRLRNSLGVSIAFRGSPDRRFVTSSSVKLKPGLMKIAAGSAGSEGLMAAESLVQEKSRGIRVRERSIRCFILSE